MKIAPADRLDLSQLAAGDIIRWETTGPDDDVRRYAFGITEPGQQPTGKLIMQGPDQEIVGPNTVVLAGTGSWTTHRQNPVQTFLPEKQVSIGYGIMRLGQLVVFSVPKNNDIGVMKDPCTELEVRKNPAAKVKSRARKKT